jgi:hypothetical protein
MTHDPSCEKDKVVVTDNGGFLKPCTCNKETARMNETEIVGEWMRWYHDPERTDRSDATIAEYWLALRVKELVDLREKLTAETFPHPSESGQFAMHTDGYNQGIEDAVALLDELIEKPQ